MSLRTISQSEKKEVYANIIEDRMFVNIDPNHEMHILKRANRIERKKVLNILKTPNSIVTSYLNEHLYLITNENFSYLIGTKKDLKILQMFRFNEKLPLYSLCWNAFPWWKRILIRKPKKNRIHNNLIYSSFSDLILKNSASLLVVTPAPTSL